MSAPPSYEQPQNSDSRALPEGWISQYDSNYKAWFYVNTRANPPVTTWVHPLGPPPPQQYAPPSGPPPPNNNYGYGNSGSYGSQSPVPPSGPSYPQQGGGYNGGGYGYDNSQGGYSGYGSGGSGYNQGYSGQSPPPTQYNTKPSKGVGGLLGGLFGGKSSNQGGYGGYPQQQQVAYAQAPPKKSGFGAGKMALAGGAGLLGGVLIADEIGDMREDAYEDGFAAGDDYGDGDFGGGDW